MNKLMIIEDSQIIREELKSLLTRYGYNVIACENFENILEDIEKERPELILLDINLPVYDGFHICREVRKTLNIPIIIVTSRDSEIDELMSMNLGADDFITKPYNTQILIARISAVLKRTYTDVSSDVLVYKDLSLDLSKGTITAFGQSVELSKNEIKILAHLMKNKEKIVSRDDLMNYMWNSDVYIDDNTLSVNMTRIRKKLEE
ncbi:response regulator transcription factor [Paraclostridium bifermentans]|uniref:response regulator transcription factor n=1 Tax=Paraclostridium bifermentans TaxID=1490 RepID=UPI00242A3FE3|nr:response regulator transcription factor [Paraclostridium bifermentans]